jgi:hypothetical protein
MMDATERRELLDRWAELLERARNCPVGSDAEVCASDWTRKWRAKGYPLPPATDSEIEERVEFLEALLEAHPELDAGA